MSPPPMSRLRHHTLALQVTLTALLAEVPTTTAHRLWFPMEPTAPPLVLTHPQGNIVYRNRYGLVSQRQNHLYDRVQRAAVSRRLLLTGQAWEMRIYPGFLVRNTLPHFLVDIEHDFHLCLQACYQSKKQTKHSTSTRRATLIMYIGASL